MQLKVQTDRAVEIIREKLERFFSGDGKKNGIREKQLIRLTAAIEPVDMLNWLLRQENYVKIYWRDRENAFAVAGVGIADQVTEKAGQNGNGAFFPRLTAYLQSPDPHIRYYGGIRFNPLGRQDENWQKFGAFRFIVPRFEVYTENSATHFACNFLFDPAANDRQQLHHLLKELTELNWPDTLKEIAIPSLISRTDYPDRAGWQENINAALKLFRQGKIDKIVLARKSRFQFAGNLDALDLLRRLQKVDLRAFHFCFQPQQGVAFIGGTPERLYLRNKNEIFSEAVAGTRPRGKSPEADHDFNHELLRSEKDNREHRFVFDSILKSLQQVCSAVEAQENVSVLQLSKVQHLYAGIHGALKNGISDSRILSHLHPTPAVGGFPRKSALQQIEALEPFDRGWYAGPVGWVSKDAAEFAVAIRSGLVAGDKIFLYSGAGIVPGSSPDKEWEEIENKIGNFIKT